MTRLFTINNLKLSIFNMQFLWFQVNNLKKILKGVLDYNMDVSNVCMLSWNSLLNEYGDVSCRAENTLIWIDVWVRLMPVLYPILTPIRIIQSKVILSHTIDQQWSTLTVNWTKSIFLRIRWIILDSSTGRELGKCQMGR